VTDAELVRAILENPDDDSAYLVYADWLMAQGDPRGELIVLQHDADEAERARKPALKRAANAHLEKHAKHFLGPLADFKGGTSHVTWRYGFARKVTLDWNSARRRKENDAVDLVAEILQHPTFTFVIEMQIGCIYNDYWEVDLQSLIDTFVELGKPAAVRLLDLGITNASRMTTDSFELGPLVAALPELRRIRLRERRFEAPRPDDPVHEMTIERRRKKKPGAALPSPAPDGSARE
jgi:uncharacterized protein (TIGR02996 family)